jgi:Bacterial regulatory protein, Fis family
VPALAGAVVGTGFELGKPLSRAVAELEANAIRAALQATGNNKQATVRLLGMARATLYEKLALIAVASTDTPLAPADFLSPAERNQSPAPPDLFAGWQESSVN